MAWNKTNQQQYKRSGSKLTDEEWAIVEPLLPPPCKRGRPRKVELRVVFDAIQYMLDAGCQWRAIPACFPPFTTIQNYDYKWRKDGTYAHMMDALRRGCRKLAGRSEEPSAAIIDSQSVKTTESGGPAGYDAGKKIKGRKRHIVVDVEGFPIEIAIHAASIQDRDGAVAVIQGMRKKAPHVEKVWADCGYRGPKLEGALEKLGLGGLLEIVAQRQGVKGFEVLPRRWVVERTFAWMGRCRRLSKDYERSLESSLAWAQLAACRFMLRRLARANTA